MKLIFVKYFRRIRETSIAFLLAGKSGILYHMIDIRHVLGLEHNTLISYPFQTLAVRQR